MFRKMKLKNISMLFFLIVGVVPTLVVGLLVQHYAGRHLKEHIIEQLESIRGIKKNQIESYFEHALLDMAVFAKSKDVLQLHSKLLEYHKAMDVKPDGPYDVTTDEYRNIWQDFGVNVHEFRMKSGYHNILITCAAHGHVMYTSAMESDLGTNLVYGPNKASGLAKLHHEIIASKEQAVIDFEPYAPHDNEPAAFAGAPIYDANNTLIGVLAVQLSIDKINEIMHERTGLGETGETYLVGSDKLMRSDSYLDPQTHSVVASFAGTVQANGIDTEASRRALAGAIGTDIMTDHKGITVLCSYAPIKVGDLNWVILADVHKSEDFASITALTSMIVIVVGFSIVVVVLISTLISRLLSRKLNSETSQLQTASSQLKSASQQQLISATEQNAVTGQVSATMNELAVTAKQVSERCLQVSHQADNAMACCKDGGQAVQQAQMVMKEIKGHIGKIVQHMLDLGQKSQQINLAVEIITELSEQTTILSYNAAIEAASAGDANQGFAVVAEQVGKLAERAKEATRDVRSLIEEIQKATNTTVMATEDTIKTAKHGLEVQDEASKKMNQIAEEIQATLDSVREIEMSSKQQTTATEQVKEGISNIVSAVKETEASSKQTQATADQLVTSAENLRNI